MMIPLNNVPPDPMKASLTDLDQILISFRWEIYDLAMTDWAIVVQRLRNSFKTKNR